MPSPSPARIALVEDDPIMGESVVQRLAIEGYAPTWWQSGREAIGGLRAMRPDLVICDVRLPDMSGEDVFRDALPIVGNSPFMFITAYGDIDQAVRLVRSGADDYLTKPFQMEELLGRIEHLLGRHQPADPAPPVLGASEAIRRVEALLRRVANIDSTVLLTGESGVGKEVAARFLHEQSDRADKPFVAVNCAAIPTELIESELFGHERGAFTGAVERHQGYAGRAGGGTLFLDEISELSPAVQAKLLRLIQERTFLRVGGERQEEFRARVVCSSNADLEALVRSGRFRRDLYYRINVIPVHIAPLRERPEDVPLLLNKYVAFFAETLGGEVRGLALGAEMAALAHDWPGNVRELRNRVERAVALASGAWITAGDLFPEQAVPVADARPDSLAAARDAAERRQIVAALEQTGGQIKKAAELLGISRTTLWERMRRLDLGGGGRT